MTLRMMVADSPETAADALKELRRERGWPVCGATLADVGGLVTVCLLGSHDDGPHAWETADPESGGHRITLACTSCHRTVELPKVTPLDGWTVPPLRCPACSGRVASGRVQVTPQ